MDTRGGRRKNKTCKRKNKTKRRKKMKGGKKTKSKRKKKKAKTRRKRGGREQVEEEAPPEKVDENEGKGVPPTIDIDSIIKDSKVVTKNDPELPKIKDMLGIE